ncbi:hypothetical protein CH35J_010579 [Colletotrichum higginsianum]|uniref:Uncharacterized protein n=1 Tax=Colletotrichum higginsianum TaxID=80884 RepID=A0A4T0VLA9_9PEZI|nr:hypothetical protein CH35J_010579 [Colletotrichum higginsianum]
MIVQKTWPQYIAVRVLIVMMRDLGLLGFTYFYAIFALGGVKAIAHPVSIFIEVIAAIEVLFYLFFFLPYRWYLQTYKPYRPPPMSRSQRARLFYKALSLVPDGEDFVRKWMLNAHMEDIRRENLKDWLLWALFEHDNTTNRPTKEINAELDQYIDDAEETFGIKLRSGRGKAEALRLSFDPVIIQHRSLFYYMVIGIFDNLMALYLLTQGYRYYKQPFSTFFKVFPVRLVNLLPFTHSAADGMSYWEPTPSIRGRTGHGNEWEIWWASATDAGTAYTLARRLCWRESLMWREMLTPSLRNIEAGYYASGSPEETAVFGNGVQVGMRSTVILGGEDCVTAPKSVASYVYSGDVRWSPDDIEIWKRYEWTGKQELELMFLDGKDHGQGIMVPFPHKPIQNVIETYCRRDDGFEPFGDKFIGGPESIYGMPQQTQEVVELKNM